MGPLVFLKTQEYRLISKWKASLPSPLLWDNTSVYNLRTISKEFKGRMKTFKSGMNQRDNLQLLPMFFYRNYSKHMNIYFIPNHWVKIKSKILSHSPLLTKFTVCNIFDGRPVTLQYRCSILSLNSPIYWESLLCKMKKWVPLIFSSIPTLKFCPLYHLFSVEIYNIYNLFCNSVFRLIFLNDSTRFLTSINVSTLQGHQYCLCFWCATHLLLSCQKDPGVSYTCSQFESKNIYLLIYFKNKIAWKLQILEKVL